MAKTKIEVVKKSLPVVPRVEEDWEKQLAADAKADKATFTSGVARITVDGMKFVVDGTKTGKNEILVVVVEHAWSKEYYERAWQPGVTSTPECYAFGHSEKGLIAHAAAPDKQNVKDDGTSHCDDCRHNVFGSAVVGRGKRCADKPRLLVVLGHDVEASTAQKVGTYQLTVPPSSLKGFSQYLGSLGDFTPHGNVREAVTKITVEPLSGKSGHALVFEFDSLVPREAMPVLLKRKEGAYEQLTQPFPNLEEKEAEAPAKPVKGQGSNPKGKR